MGTGDWVVIAANDDESALPGDPRVAGPFDDSSSARAFADLINDDGGGVVAWAMRLYDPSRGIYDFLIGHH